MKGTVNERIRFVLIFLCLTTGPAFSQPMDKLLTIQDIAGVWKISNEYYFVQTDTRTAYGPICASSEQPPSMFMGEVELKNGNLIFITTGSTTSCRVGHNK